MAIGDTEAELRRRFRDGDHAAFTEIYHLHHRALRGVAFALLGDAEAAAEAVQLAFVRAWTAAAGFDPERELRPWLYAITRRAAVDVHRSNSRQAPGVELDESAMPGESDVDQMDRTWTSWQIQRALRELPRHEKDVMVLTYHAGLSQAEIGAALRIPVGTVKSRMSRAHRKLSCVLASTR